MTKSRSFSSLATAALVLAFTLCSCPDDAEQPTVLERSVSKEERDLDEIKQAVDEAAAEVTAENAVRELEALEAEIESELEAVDGDRD